MVRILKPVSLSLFLAGAISAASVNINPAAVIDTGWKKCAAFAGYGCRTTAYFDTNSLNTQNDEANINFLFQSAFDAWNASGGGQGWTLAFGGSLTGTFDVTIAKTEQFDEFNTQVLDNVARGGLEINISVANITLPALKAGDQYVWTQGLFDNYLSNGAIVRPFYEMDVDTGDCNPAGPASWCPPAYPLQFVDKKFYDQPNAFYQAPGTTQGFFDANTYFAIENNGAKRLTVYDGVSYGFQNFVSPEPGVWLLSASGLLIVILIRSKRFPS